MKKKLIYLDNSASTQKPQRVIDKISDYYKTINSNVHRGVHTLSQKATQEYENSREKVRNFINAKSYEEIIFTKGTTDSLNLISNILKNNLNKGDEVILSIAEHHSNIVPWQFIAKEKGIKLKFVELDKEGKFNFEQYKNFLNEKTKIISLQHISNAIGNINPVEKIISEAKKIGAIVILDCAQSAPHIKLDVQKLDCDFIAFSGQKMYSPTGIGILYGKKDLLEKLPPYQGGGDMIKEVSLQSSTYADLPLKYETGTPNIEGAIGLGEAIDFIDEIGIENISRYEDDLYKCTLEEISSIENIEIYGGGEKTSAISFNIKGIHSFDLGSILDKMGIAVRTGHHCCQPLMKYLNIEGTVRVSLAIYNTKEDIDILKKAILKAVKFFI